MRLPFVLLAAAVVAAPSITVPAAAASQDKVTICHRTSATKNPYQQITVAQSSVDGTGGKGDHYLNHTGPVWSPGMPNGGMWGDIIPPIPRVREGLNWTARGRAIYDAGCDEPAVAATPGKPSASDEDQSTKPGKPSASDEDENGPGRPDAGSSDEQDSQGDVPEGSKDQPEQWIIGDESGLDSDDDGIVDVVDGDDDQDGLPDAVDADDNGDGIVEAEDQEIVGTELPNEIAPGEPVLLAREGEVTTADVPVRTEVRCTAKTRSLPTGDIASPGKKKALCRVKQSGKRWVLEVFGTTPTTVQIKRSAAASGVYSAMVEVRAYKVR